MQFIKADPSVPFAGGIQHDSYDGLTTDCGLKKEPGDLVADDMQPLFVWAALCKDCFPSISTKRRVS